MALQQDPVRRITDVTPSRTKRSGRHQENTMKFKLITLATTIASLAAVMGGIRGAA